MTKQHWQLAVLVVVCGAVMALIAWPNLRKMIAVDQQDICRVDLRSIVALERAYFEKHGEYSDSAEAIGFRPDRARYAYVFGRNLVHLDLEFAKKERLAERIPEEIRQTLHVDKDAFTIACVGDLDGDDFVDVWTVSSQPRTINGHVIPAFERRVDRSDVLDEVVQ